MENDLKVELLKESLNKQKMNKINNIRPKEEEIKNNIEEFEINYNRFEEIKEENIKMKDNKYEEITKIIKEENEKKINNKRVNNLLKDIYGSLTNLNDVNDRVKNILSKRQKMKSVSDFRRNIKDEKSNSNIKNKRKSLSNNKKEITNSVKENMICSEYLKSVINNNNNRNISCYENELTKNETGSINFKSKNSNTYLLSKFDNISTNNQTKQSNQIFFNKLNSPEQISGTQNNFNKNKFYKYKEIVINDNSENLNEKNNNDSSNIINNSGLYKEEYENEKIIRYMRVKLKNEEKKLKALEEQKNKLLNEEKIRRKVLMEKIRKKNKIKKKRIINEYKNKINLVQKLQTNNINEIRKLEIKKKIDEENIMKIDKICENILINENSLKNNKEKTKIRNKLNKSRIDNSSEGFNYLVSDTESQSKSVNKNHSSNYQIFTNNHLIRNSEMKNANNYNNESGEAITEDFQFNNSINELTSTCDNFDENETFSRSREMNKKSYKRKLNFDECTNKKKEKVNPYNYLYSYYKKINENNNRCNCKDENLNVDNYLKHNTKKKKYYSETRKYDKKINNTNSTRKSRGSFTPNQGVLSFIKTRVNKYNYNMNKESNISKRFSQMTAYPSYLMNNINLKYNYKYIPSSASSSKGFNNLSRKSSQRNEGSKSKNTKDLNFKYIFFKQ